MDAEAAVDADVALEGRVHGGGIPVVAEGAVDLALAGERARPGADAVGADVARGVGVAVVAGGAVEDRGVVDAGPDLGAAAVGGARVAVVAVDRRRLGLADADRGVGLDVLGAGVAVVADRLAVLVAGPLEVSVVEVGVEGVLADADGVPVVDVPGREYPSKILS